MITFKRGCSGPTLIEVAEAARVSRQTVSNAINAPHLLRPDTLARVLAAIDELGYVPNRMARGLRTRESGQIGYLLDGRRHGPDAFVQDRFLYALSAAAEAQGYLLVLFNRGPGDEPPTRYPEMLGTGSVDGFVLYRIGADDPGPALLADRRVPCVCFGRPGGEAAGAMGWVDVDASAGTRAAVDHLIAAGHRNIAFLGLDDPPGPAAYGPGEPGAGECGAEGTGEPRLAGWRRAMLRYGLPADRCEYVTGTREDAARGALRLLTRADPPTAVVTANDTLALGCYAAARQLGLEIGRDFAVIGFDDSPAASLVTPTLTSVRQPLGQIGHEVMRLLTARLRGLQTEQTGVLLTPSLALRESA